MTSLEKILSKLELLGAEPRIARKDTEARARRAERTRAFLAELWPTLLDRYPYKL